MLTDRFERAVRYLRLSITSACPMRCVYCRPAAEKGDVSGDALSAEEIVAVVRVLVERYGLKKVRLTGGEPTARPELRRIIANLRSIEGLGEIAMTTNGLTLARCAREFADAGLSRVNISLDSLRPDRFKRVTGIDGLSRVIRAIDSALAAGLTPVKLNAVVVRGENHDELGELVTFAADRGIEIRFIELMPMGPLAGQWADRYVPESEIRALLGSTVARFAEPLGPASAPAKSGVAILHDGRAVRIGFISAMSCPFCEACDRIRIASDGRIFPCLMDRPAGSLLPALRPAISESRIADELEKAMHFKPEQHPAQGFVQMTRIGG